MMRLEPHKDGSFAVWMAREEYHDLIRFADSWMHEIALRLMGDCGLRVAEAIDTKPTHISRHSDGRHYRLRVPHGKDTTGEHLEGEYRETWLPVETERYIHRYTQDEHIDNGECLIQRSRRTVQRWVHEIGERAAEETGNMDYRHVSSHDLRRCWAHHLGVEESISPRILMALGGWGSFEAIEPYLLAPSEKNIITSMSAVDL